MKIIDIKKERFSYYSNDVEKLAEVGYVKMNYTSSLIKPVDKNDAEDIVKCDIEYSLYLHSEEISDTIETEDIETDACISGKYAVIVDHNNQPDDELIEFASTTVEPYIRRDIIEFCKEIQIPTFPLPYRFWDRK
ncbi:hypothetical protein [Lysinibacillus irui]|uniref:hypothetical protein n=1 Tax=Lysinibacillus irui TaxID=2998077 RepID=UPI002AD57CAB|nr:hypothetical protein [Lysinibacillus irui]MEA0565007.1 hypothetical protein [Lysinibacillus irui]